MTLELEGLTLLRPWWLLALPTIGVLAVLAARQRAVSGWRRVIDPAFVAHLETFGFLRLASRDITVPMLAAIAAVAALALSGPATRSPSAPALRNLNTVVFAVDLSRSVAEGGALDTVRVTTARLLKSAAGRPAALLVFAADAYVASPPTDDPRLLDTLIAVLDGDTMPVNGSRPDRALVLAGEMLTESVGHHEDIVLISDGGGIGPDTIAAAQALRERGASISTVYVAPTTFPADMPPPAPDALERLSDAGGGMSVDAAAPQRLTRALESNAAGERTGDVVALTYDDHGRLVLVLALVPALLLFGRRR
ncbi:MAG: VWA domain-containing protein [Pseudomonadota bacterium]